MQPGFFPLYRPSLKERDKRVRLASEYPPSLKLQGEHDHPGAQAVDNIGVPERWILCVHIVQPLADLDLGRYDHIFAEELEPDACFHAKIGFVHFQKVFRIGGTGFGCQVVIKFYARQCIYPEIVDPVAFESHLQRKAHDDGFHVLRFDQGGLSRFRVFEVVPELFFAEDQVQRVKPDVPAMIELQVGQNTEMDPSAVESVHRLDGVLHQEARRMRNPVVRGIIPQDDAEIVQLIIMIGKVIGFPQLRKRGFCTKNHYDQ